MNFLTQDQQEKELSAFLKKPQNALCADCSSKSPCWASLDFGVFVCMNCSGAHRSLGQSVTRIKSVKLDTWKRDWIWYMQLNNKMINEYYEACKNSVMNKKPNPNSSLAEIKKFVTDKYVRKLYAQDGQDDPITNLKNGKLPLKVCSAQGHLNEAKTKQAHLNAKKLNSKLQELMKKAKVQNQTDHASDLSNKKVNTLTHKRNEVNLIDVAEETENKQSCIQNKHIFQSLSGKEAQQNSKANQLFDPFFTQQIHFNGQNASKNRIDSFDVFKQITASPSSLPKTPSPPTFSTQSNFNSTQAHSPLGYSNAQSFPYMSSTSTSGDRQTNLLSAGDSCGRTDIGISLETERKEQGIGSVEQIRLQISELRGCSQVRTASWIDEWK